MLQVIATDLYSCGLTLSPDSYNPDPIALLFYLMFFLLSLCLPPPFVSVIRADAVILLNDLSVWCAIRDCPASLMGGDRGRGYISTSFLFLYG